MTNEKEKEEQFRAKRRSKNLFSLICVTWPVLGQHLNDISGRRSALTIGLVDQESLESFRL